MRLRGVPHPSAPSARERRCPCPSRPEQLPPARSAGQLARAVTKATTAGGPGGWRAPGRPPRGPSPGVGCPRDGVGEGGEEKSAPPPILPQEVRARVQSPLGALHPRMWGVPSLFSWGAPPLLHRLPCAQAPFFSRQVCGSPAVCPPFRALTVRGGAAPPHPTPRTWPPGLSPTWMYAIFARAHSLRPGHGAATATLPSPTGERGESKGGKEEKGSRVAPDVTGVADERRPPLRRPPRPCLPLRSGSGSRGRLPGWESSGAQGPRLGLPRRPALPPRRSPGGIKAGAPGEGARGSRGDCSDPSAGGAGDAGARARQRRGRGPGRARRWEGAVRGSAHPVGTGAGTYREQGPRGGCEAERARSSPPQSLEPGGSSPSSPFLDRVGKTLFPPHPTRLELLR